MNDKSFAFAKPIVWMSSTQIFLWLERVYLVSLDLQEVPAPSFVFVCRALCRRRPEILDTNFYSHYDPDSSPETLLIEGRRPASRVK